MLSLICLFMINPDIKLTFELFLPCLLLFSFSSYMLPTLTSLEYMWPACFKRHSKIQGAAIFFIIWPGLKKECA